MADPASAVGVGSVREQAPDRWGPGPIAASVAATVLKACSYYPPEERNDSFRVVAAGLQAKKSRLI